MALGEELKLWFAIARVNLMRGIHQCSLCPIERGSFLPLKDQPSISVGGHLDLLGHWELWIPGSGGKVFASPALVIHYVDAHRYRPPEEYIAAVMNDKVRSQWNAADEFAIRTSRQQV